MGKYFLLQLKRFARLFPFAFCVVFVLFCGLMIVMNGIVQSLSDPDADTKVQIAIVGEAEDSFLQMGITALQSLDTSRFAVEVLSMEEAEAVKALERGQIGAYVVIPEGFVEEALHGRVKTLKFVSTVGAAGLVSMFKSEITQVISGMVLACQRGMFGIENAYLQTDGSGDYGDHVYELSLSYAEFVLIRAKAYQVEEIGLSAELSFEQNLLSGICVLFMTLAVLPFGPLLIKQDLSVDKLLLAKRHSTVGLVLCEYTSFFICFLAQMLLTAIVVTFGVGFIDPALAWHVRKVNVFEILPVIFVVTSFGYMIFGFSSHLTGGILLQFFSGLFICFVSGCMYPISFFPEAMRRVVSRFAHSIARQCVADWLTGAASAAGAVLMLYGILFLVIAVFVRKQRTAALGG